MSSNTLFSKFIKIPTINKVILVLVASDLIIFFGFGLYSPIFAVFVEKQIKGATLETIGISSAIFLAVRSLIQIPLAKLLDIKKGIHDNYYVLLIGTFIYCAVPFLYTFASTISQLFAIQALYGIGTAFAFASWNSVFTHHIDKNHVATEWSLYYTSMDLGGAAAAAIGAGLASSIGFRNLYVLVGILAIFGASLLLIARRRLIK